MGHLSSPPLVLPNWEPMTLENLATLDLLTYFVEGPHE